MHQQLNGYRERFRIALVGVWQTAQGTFDQVSGDTVTFRPDHTGVIEYGSAFSGETAARFEWREKGERTIEVRFTDDEDDRGEEAEPWGDLVYDFRVNATDVGGEVVLHEVGREGFWDSEAPLRFLPDE